MRLLVFISFVLTTGFSLAQQRFNKIYADSTNGTFGATAILEIGVEEYVAIGQKTTTEGRGVVLYKINQFGDTIGYKEHFFANECLYTTKAIKRDNDFLVVGNRIADCDDVNDDNSNDMSLMSFDFNLNMNWTKTYGGNYFDSGRDLLQNYDGSLLLCGTKSPSSANLENFYLVKTDENGNVLWERTYGGNNVDKAWSIIKSHQNGYLVSGVSNSFSSIYKVLVYSLDENGVELWHQSYGTGTVPVYAGHAVALLDKSYLLYKNVENPFPNYVAEIIKIDANGELIWTKNYAETTLSSFDLAKPLSLEDGTMLLTGIVYNASDKPVGRILKLDPTGTIIWSRKYERNPNIDQYIYDVKQTSDNGFVFSGFAFDTTTPIKQRFWVAKLDCFGCDGVLCDFPDSACQVYDCTGKDFSSNFTLSTDTVFTNNNQPVVFTNTATETSNREWIFPDTTIYTSGTVNYQFNQAGTYSVKLITYHGACSDTTTQTIVVINTADLTNMEMDKLVQIYPNPMKNYCTIEHQLGGRFEYEITNALGQVIHHNSSSEKKTNIQVDLTKGIYFIRINNLHGELVKKMIVE